MVKWFLNRRRGAKWSLLSSFLTCASVITAMVLSDSQPAYTLPVQKVMAIPAFARKYGLPCSACHTAWPELNNFGQVFRDNGFQLGNDKDSPIYQNPSYFPITFRITPNWHRESTNHQPVDAVPGDPTTLGEGKVLQHGFDLSGMDIWTAGTLYKNISFSLLPSSNINATFHFENAYVRFDNLLKSRWINLKFGKFELDNLVSEKRFLFLSANGGLYQNYHFTPPGDSTGFGLGDNQLGVELSGHSANSYTRYGIAVLGSNEGGVGLPSNRTYDTYLTFSQAFEVGKLGLQRLGAFAYIGRRPTFSQTSSGGVIAGTGMGNKPFYRVGFAGDLYVGKLELMPFFLHGYDNVFLGTSTPANMPLLPGARAPTWNGGFLELHYYVSPQLVLTHRSEIIQMSRGSIQGSATVIGNGDVGNIGAVSFGYRWYPIMFSRAGLAWHNEYSITRTQGAVPLSGDGTGLAALTALNPASKVWSNSIFLGFDLDF